ncbi:MAG: GGDEF domain-containing protein [bacterium]
MSSFLDFASEKLSYSNSLSSFQQALLAVHLQRICVPLLYALGLFAIFYCVVIGQAGSLIMSSRDWGSFNAWRWTVSALMTLMVTAIYFSRTIRRRYHWAFTMAYLPAAFVSGYFLSGVAVGNHAVMYILYLVPFFTLVLPGALMERVLATVGSFVMLPGIYLARGWDPIFFTGITLVLGSIVIISILVGHFAIYRLNRINFFQSRELHRTKNRIEELAMFDQLTGLYERHELDKRIEQEYDRARRTQNEFSVLMVDLDHFKDVNDNYGHDMGDTVLETFGEIIGDVTEDKLRSSDVAGRYGGEEFCIMLPTADQGGASTVAERIRKELKSRTFETDDGETFSVTCSIGAAELTPDIHDPEDLVKKADQALYEAKESGRDQVCIYSELETT